MFTDVQEVGVQVSEQSSAFRLHETRTAPETKVWLLLLTLCTAH